MNDTPIEGKKKMPMVLAPCELIPALGAPATW